MKSSSRSQQMTDTPIQKIVRLKRKAAHRMIVSSATGMVQALACSFLAAITKAKFRAVKIIFSADTIKKYTGFQFLQMAPIKAQPHFDRDLNSRKAAFATKVSKAQTKNEMADCCRKLSVWTTFLSMQSALKKVLRSVARHAPQFAVIAEAANAQYHRGICK